MVNPLTQAMNTTGNAANALGTAANVTSNLANDLLNIISPAPGLPSSAVQSGRIGANTRNLISWFVPEFGVIQMYINPRQIRYAHKKLITPEMTKGGYNLQYWGEQLSTITLSGTTGSSGIEGINVLYEIYRAEQYAFDALGLAYGANNAITGAANQVTAGIAGSLGGSVGVSVAASLGGTDPTSQMLSAQNIPSLAQFAFGVEMFYLGWIYRGYFDSMNITESADNLGLFEYDITFFVTSRAGYRLNNLAWQKSAISGPSGDYVPLSFAGMQGG